MYAEALLSTEKKDPTTETIRDPLVGMFIANKDP
jgi:hypothetical protein